MLVSAAFMIEAHAGSGDTARLSNDSTRQQGISEEPGAISTGNPEENNTDDLVESNLLQTENYAIKTRADVRALFHYLKSTKLRGASRDKRISYRLYFGLAKTFVRMKLYPLAMKCYYQTQLLAANKIPVESDSRPAAETETATSFYPADIESIASTASADDSLSANILSVNEPPNQLPFADTVFAQYLRQKQPSLPMSNDAIINSYNDGKQGVAYAIVLHVKQPVPGKRTSFALLNNVGHFFITLLKYNADSGCVSRSFGFYPDKDNFLAATPLHPGSVSVLKDDALHDWDEAIGKFISRRRFEKIIHLIDHYNARKYHLNKNNCTDFGLYAATIAGVSISNTNGRWPLGRGNNPANAGQSMLERKIINTDTGNTQDLFICNNVRVR